MTTSRAGHAATLLANGKVLVAGGDDDGSGHSTAELYDPATGIFTPTGCSIGSPQQSSATLLPDGRVLARGRRRHTALPKSTIPPPGSGRHRLDERFSGEFQVAVLLPNGKVLIVGGLEEIYDPATGTWTITGRMRVLHSALTATLLPNGKVLAVGGDPLQHPHGNLRPGVGNVDRSRNHECRARFAHSDVAGRWQSARDCRGSDGLFVGACGNFRSSHPPVVHDGSLPIPRLYHTATRLSDGRVLVAGGQGGTGAISGAALYDPGTGLWTTTNFDGHRAHQCLCDLAAKREGARRGRLQHGLAGHRGVVRSLHRELDTHRFAARRFPRPYRDAFTEWQSAGRRGL